MNYNGDIASVLNTMLETSERIINQIEELRARIEALEKQLCALHTPSKED